MEEENKFIKIIFIPALFLVEENHKDGAKTTDAEGVKRAKMWCCDLLVMCFFAFKNTQSFCCLDNNQQVIPLSHYFSNGFVSVGRWTLQGCGFVLLCLLFFLSAPQCTVEIFSSFPAC